MLDNDHFVIEVYKPIQFTLFFFLGRKDRFNLRGM